MTLYEFVLDHAIRGVCQCGQCIDAPPNPEKLQPIGHTADLIFFKVALKKVITEEEMKTTFLELIKKEQPHWLDGKEHNYLEMGANIGDQGVAMMAMGMGNLLGVWDLLTPESVLPGIPDHLKMMMAGRGLISITTKKTYFFSVQEEENDPEGEEKKV